MKADLHTLPFSRRGSYLVISELNENWNGCGNEAGLYLRTVHSSAMTPLVARVLPEQEGQPKEYSAEIRDGALVLDIGRGRIEICFDDPETMLIRGSAGIQMTLDFLSGSGPYDYIYRFSRDGRAYEMANCFKNNCRYLISMIRGKAELDQEWRESSSVRSRLTFFGDTGFMLALREIETEWDGTWKEYSFEESRNKTAEDLKDFQQRMPSCPGMYAETAEKAGYLLWTSIVRKEGFLPRDAMLMSKNWMKSVWSWDHCFNAIALSYHAPELAWDQYMIMFDCQDSTGLLPDSINDVHVVWNYCKPPVHGWALRWMMRQMELTAEQMAEAYERLSKWTDWWMTFRDYDGDGLYEYNHGNDSGWDNSTAFSVLPPVTTPELQAFLIIQMDVLSDLATRLCRLKDAEQWKIRSESLLQRFLNRMFADDLPVVLRSGSHDIIQNESLLPFICIVLGEKLLAPVRQRMIEILSGEKFRSTKGFATESLQSPEYRNDGYWRGPIWAPSTMLLTDGLYRCGEKKLARDTAARFADMVSTSGFAENFDAVTGEGLRDRSYTWTASVFLVMSHEYL